MMTPRFTLASMNDSTCFGPLIALGFFVREHDLWAPIRHRVKFDNPTHCLDPVGALLDMEVGILAGCEVVSQVNTKIRSDRLLAQAWGREQFTEQSTITRILDACGQQQIDQMRSALEAIYHWAGRGHRHDFRHDPLRLDIDLTGLLASRQAEGSTKGYFSGKKTLTDDSWPGWGQPIIEKSSYPNSTLAVKPAWLHLSQPSWKRNVFFTLDPLRGGARCYAWTGDSATMTTWLGPPPATTK